MCGAARALRVAVDLDSGGRVGIAAAVHPTQLVLDVREGLQHLALRELIADAAFALAAVAARAAAVHGRRRRRAGRRSVSVVGVRARTYMNAHSGNVLSVANAQNGIFLRALAAATTGMSGFGGGGPTGAAGAAAARSNGGRGRRGCGRCRAGGVAAASAAPAGVAAFGLCCVRPGCASAGARESRSRVPTIDAETSRSGNPRDRIRNAACTSSQPVDCGHRAW